MGWFLFVDESGQDGKDSPYEVLAGLAIEDRQLWRLIQALKGAQEEFFGLRLFDAYGVEAKGQKLLKRKTFKHAAQKPPLPVTERTKLAYMALTDGANVKGDQLTALGQAKIAYVEQAFNLCIQHGATAFASIVPNNMVRSEYDFLRKDYAFLFERFYHFLSTRPEYLKPMGTIVFDEVEKQQSQILLGQMERYFLHTNKGRQRSSLIIPEPLFVHSDLTTMIQMADLVAYVVSWGVRLGGVRPMVAPHRNELEGFARQVCRLRYHDTNPKGFDTWGFVVIGELKAANGDEGLENEKGNANLSVDKASAA
ncbi:DUF3800 domain-containing protein [Paeniroseomonas aquatica]|uniref:DUF3800 domain-containing protein n=1 Tax=Paeniroseomonas aquatica TaxID=373043 RepID=A0ABT8A8G7_9PROT|nr:DUF3800 domain-containing protein [Paeniroseomonas aquatica]MDN3566014.1 DUF3800 domain-containing protein [Paeniroseomonas aquatica]